MLILTDRHSESIPIVINFPVLTQDQIAAKKLLILPVPGLENGGNVDITNDKVGFVVLRAKGSKKDSDDASSRELVTKWRYQNVL